MEELELAGDIHEEGVAQALDAIRAGGDHLVMQVRQRVWLALDSLLEGDFAMAGTYLADAQQAVSSLASATAFIAIADGSRLIKAAEAEVGMTLTSVGEITEISSSECPDPRCRRHITLKVGEHEYDYRGNQEIYVETGVHP